MKGIFLISTILLFFSVSAQILNDSSTTQSTYDSSIVRNGKIFKRDVKEFIKNKPHSYNYNIFSQLYPIRDNPSVGFVTSYVPKDKILFNVHPVLSLTLFSNFKKKLKEGKLFSQGYSIIFRPQFRMYYQTSTPVKMPSYRVLLGLQHLYRIKQKHLFSYAIESGHYSNGQSGCALAGGGIDGSRECDSMWAIININSKLSEMINRTDGDFSTNLTELLLNYRFIPKFDEYSKPKQIHSFTYGMQLYHNKLFGVVNAGGYSPEAIKIYGKWRFMLAYSYNYNWKAGYRIYVTQNMEIIKGAHPSVNPVRSVTTATFFLRQSIGFYVSYIYGHDDYNLRFVDSGNQFGFGVSWDMFPPIQIGKDSN